MIDTFYSYTKHFSDIPSKTFAWINVHEKLLMTITAVANSILSLFAALNISRFNPGLGSLFFINSGINFFCAIKILFPIEQQLKANNPSKSIGPLNHGSQSIDSDYSALDRDYSYWDSSFSSNDDWRDFDD